MLQVRPSEYSAFQQMTESATKFICYFALRNETLV